MDYGIPFAQATEHLADFVRVLASNFVGNLPSDQATWECLEAASLPEALEMWPIKGQPVGMRLTMQDRVFRHELGPSVCFLRELLEQEFEPALEAKGALVRHDSCVLQLILLDPSTIFRVLSMRSTFDQISLVPTRGLIPLESLSQHLKEGQHPLMLATGRNTVHGYSEIDPYVACMHDMAHALRFSDQSAEVHQAHCEIFEVVRQLCTSRGSLYGLSSEQTVQLLDTILSGPRISRPGDVYVWLGKDIRQFLFEENRTAFLLELIRLGTSTNKKCWTERLHQGLTVAVGEHETSR